MCLKGFFFPPIKSRSLASRIPFCLSLQSDSIPVLLAPAATEAPARKRQAATDVCVLTDSLESTAKWVSAALPVRFKTFCTQCTNRVFLFSMKTIKSPESPPGALSNKSQSWEWFCTLISTLFCRGHGNAFLSPSGEHHQIRKRNVSPSDYCNTRSIWLHTGAFYQRLPFIFIINNHLIFHCLSFERWLF